MADDLYHLDWQLNEACNFDCPYCFRIGVDRHRQSEHPSCGKIAPEYLAQQFLATGKRWRINLSGGEPFLYPRFIDLIVALTQHQQVAINTNLSLPNYQVFLDRVPAVQVHRIRANVHLAERTKRKGGLDHFVDKVLNFQRAGFRIRIEFVGYPPALSSLMNFWDLCIAQGVEDFKVKLFRGVYKGQTFPAAYTPEQISLMLRVGMTDHEAAILRGGNRYWGKLCAAGQRSFSMDIEGNLFRCATVKKTYGNLFAGKVDFGSKPESCPALFCNCPYEGLKFATNKNGRVMPTLWETLKVTGRQVKDGVERRLW